MKTGAAATVARTANPSRVKSHPKLLTLWRSNPRPWGAMGASRNTMNDALDAPSVIKSRCVKRDDCQFMPE
jgi:hypothetical protein